MLVRLLAASLLGAALAAGGCALGADEAGGCRSNAECPDGFTCRAGACFRILPGVSPPADTGSGGGTTDGGGAGGHAGSGGAGSEDAGAADADGG